jgi:hypothetical protein
MGESMRFFCLILMLTLCLLIASKAAGQTACSKEQHNQASNEADRLDSWGSMHRFYIHYRQCDDGGIGEGVSESVTKLLANRWGDFAKLAAMSAAEPGFEKFVLRHVDATVPVETLRRISKNARERCQEKSELCKKVADAASLAIKEIRN